MSSILNKSVLDSKDYGDPGSVLYRGVQDGNILENTLKTGLYFDDDGDFLGIDGDKYFDRYIVGEKEEIRKIKKNWRSKLPTPNEEAPSAVVLPSDIVLMESLNVLERAIQNGGYKEECSLVLITGQVIKGKTGDEPYIDENNVYRAKAELPPIPDGLGTNAVEASIHSHPLKILTKDEQFYPFDTLNPTSADKEAFKQYSFNIIVGKIKEIKEIRTKLNPINGKIEPDIPYRNDGFTIYNKSANPLVTLSSRIVKKILSKK